MKTKYIHQLVCLFFFVVICPKLGFGQVSINNVIGNRILNTQGYEGIEGSPFFNQDWLPAEVIFYDGKKAKVEFAKYDMFLDQLFYTDSKNGKDFAFRDPIHVFTLRNSVFQNNFPPIGDFTSASYYQVIAKTKFSLLKKEENTVNERTAFGTPSIRFFKKVTRFYQYDGQGMSILKLDYQSLADAFKVKKQDVMHFANSRKLNLKNEIDLKAIFENFVK